MSLNLENFINKRNKYLIKNENILINNNNDEFHYVIYYINDKKIEIIVRKLNNNYGWNYDLKINIKDNEKNNIISIGSCEDNFKIIELYVKFRVEIKEEKKLYYIPKKIIQTNKEICKNFEHYNTIMTLIEKNPSYEYEFFNDVEARNFIKNNFIINLLEENNYDNDLSDVLNTYDLIINGAIKADLFRYSYLYINGGIYIDSKISNYIELDDIINENDKYIVCSDDAKNSLYNGIMIIEKNNYNILLMIKEIIINVKNKNYLNDIHEPTGNKLYYKFFNDKKNIIQKKGNIVYYGNRKAFKCEYNNYYNNNYDDFRKDYLNKNYYYNYNIYIKNNIFSFKNKIDKYIVFYLKDNIYVIKNNNNKEWESDIDLIVNNIENGINKKIRIKKTNETEMVFAI